MFLLPLSVVATLLAADAIEVRSFTDCPSSEAILAKLRPLLPAGFAQETHVDVAWVDSVAPGEGGAAGLRLRLVRPDATLVGDRRLVVQGSCDDMAETLASVLAAWESRPATQLGTSMSPGQASVPVAAPVIAARSVDGLTSGALRVQLGASVGTAMVGGLAATANLELVLGRERSHWQARVAGMAQTSRQQSLGTGQVSWRHSGAFLGLGWRSLGPAWQFAADAGPVLGWATLTGQGFAPDREQRAFEYGAGLALRAQRNLGPWALWLEWHTVGWSETQRAVLAGSDNRAELHGFDIMVSLGGSRQLLR